MDIVVATDDKFIQHCAVTLVSILKNNDNVHIWVLTEGLDDNNITLLKNLVANNGGQINIIKVNSDIVRKFPMPEENFVSHISLATYYRLFVSSLIPETINRIVYLDCDIVVRGSLEELFNKDITDKALAAVYQDDPILVAQEVYSRLGYDAKFGYFNAGVLLVNLDYWRKKRVEEKLIDYLSTNYNNIVFHDQDTLNAVLFDQTTMLDCKWNVLSYYLKEEMYQFTSERSQIYRGQLLGGILRNPTVVHYVSRPKPWIWTCDHPYKSEYYKYLKETPFADFKPSLVLNLENIKYLIKYHWPFSLFADQSGKYIKI